VETLPYTSYSRYLLRLYGERAYRVAVDAGFSCPNRAARGSPGCSYCDEAGSRAPYLGGARGLKSQIEGAVRFLNNRYGAQTFLLYFQAFSATNAPVEELERLYDEALGLAPFKELIVSTRPDCVDGEKARLLAGYRERGIDVWVELGLQSAKDETLGRVSRGHTAAEFTEAYRVLKRQGLKTAVHLIFGLPGETAEDMRRTAGFVSDLDPDGVKIHNLHIPAAAPLALEFVKGEVTVPAPERHLEYVITALELLSPRCLIMRLTCDTPKERLAAPRSFCDKQAFTSILARKMRERGTFQGRLFTGASRERAPADFSGPQP
jgi:radical SAM protein (TIGR01212 family)